MLLDKGILTIASEMTEPDPSGRKHYKLIEVDELVERVNEVADKVVDDWGKRGWLLEVPDMEDPEEVESTVPE